MNFGTDDSEGADTPWLNMIRSAQASRFGAGLVLVGWFHLVIFGFCEHLFARGDRAAGHFLPLWVLDVAVAFLVLRSRVPDLAMAGVHSPSRIAARVWLTFAILCLTSASLNSITGFQIDWFKISWCLLGTFGFATMAWIFHLALLIPAVQMSLTALLVAAYPDHAYGIFGLSWLVILNTLGLLLERPRLVNRWQAFSARWSPGVLKRPSP